MSSARTVQARLRAWMSLGLRSALGLILIALIFLEVTMVMLRYGFGDGIIWGRDVTILFMFLLAWLGAPLLWLDRTHLAVDVLPTRLTGSRAWRIGTEVLVLIVSAVLFVYVLQAMENAAFIDIPTLGLSSAIKYWPLALGAGLLWVAACLNLWRVLGQEGSP